MKFASTNRFLHRSLLCLSVAVLLAWAPNGEQKHRRHNEQDSHAKSDQPLHAEACSVMVSMGSIVLYKDTNFSGHEEVFKIAGKTQHELHKISGKLSNNTSSLRWNLPPGVVVVLYGPSATNPHRQYVIWGQGQDSRLTGHGVNDKLSAICIEKF